MLQRRPHGAPGTIVLPQPIELRQPLGYTMVGGLVLSQALTLFTTPVVYLYLDRLNARLSRGRRAGEGNRAVAGPGNPATAALQMKY